MQKNLIKQIEQILKVMLKYNPTRNARFQNIFKMKNSHLDCPSFIKIFKYFFNSNVKVFVLIS
jgi:hypothetical protein